MCQRSSGVLGRRLMKPEPSLADICFLRSFIRMFGAVTRGGGKPYCLSRWILYYLN